MKASSEQVVKKGKTRLFTQIATSKTEQPESKQPEPPKEEQKKRRKGLQREVAKRAMNWIESQETGTTVSKAEVVKKYKIGTGLVRDIFEKMVEDRILKKKPNGRYYR